MTQIALAEGMKVRAEVVQGTQWRHLAGVVEDYPVEMPTQAAAAQQVVADHRRQAQAELAAMVMLEQTVAAYYHDIQAVQRIIQHCRVLAFEQVIEQLHTAA